MLLPKQIIGLGKIVAKAAGRYAYSAVRIERQEHGPRAMATDGRRAVVFSWDEPQADQFPPIEGLSSARSRQFAANIPPKTLAQAGRGIAKRKSNSVMGHLLLDESEASMVRVAAMSNEKVTRAQVKVEDSSFPDCNAVLPTPAREGNVYEPGRHGAAFTHTRIGVNARQLAETLKVVCDLACDDTHNTVVMTVPVDANRPIRLDARCDGRRAVAAIMPVSADFARYDEPREPPRRQALPSPRRRVNRSKRIEAQPQKTIPGG